MRRFQPGCSRATESCGTPGLKSHDPAFSDEEARHISKTVFLTSLPAFRQVRQDAIERETPDNDTAKARPSELKLHRQLDRARPADLVQRIKAPIEASRPQALGQCLG